MGRGIFITFEGPEGGGKSSQIALLVEKAKNQGLDVLETREPGGTYIGEQIRQILLSHGSSAIANKTEMLLYAASRAQHVEEVIRPALDEGKIVICDRFIDASIAYQGYGLGLSIEEITEVNKLATGGIVPDRTYMLDLPVELGMRRISTCRGCNEDLQAVGLDRIESKDVEYHRQVREGFLRIAEQDAERVLIVDAAKGIEEVAIVVWEDFHKLRLVIG